MDKLAISPTATSPEIYFSVEENQFRIAGVSRPEDVRAIYYPVTEWIKQLADQITEGSFSQFNKDNPVRFQVDLKYFNSSSAKFLYDIFVELKRLPVAGVPVNVEWYYEYEDTDMLEAGNDISILVEMEFTYFQKED